MVHELASVKRSRLFVGLEIKTGEINIWFNYHHHHQPFSFGASSIFPFSFFIWQRMINCSFKIILSCPDYHHLNSKYVKNNEKLDIYFFPSNWLTAWNEEMNGIVRSMVNFNSPPIEGLNVSREKCIDHWSRHAPIHVTHSGHSSMCGKKGVFHFISQQDRTRKKKKKMKERR